MLLCKRKWNNQKHRGRKSINQAKTFIISKEVVARAYLRVKANRGTYGVDKQTIEEFEVRLEDNLYKIWNRMSSGCYMPPKVRLVEIPKKDGKKRGLGIPTVGDRVAQMVAKIYLEPHVEPLFHQDSYGYRPNKTTHDALAATRKRCWEYDWVIDLDIKGFFDNIDHELMMRAVRKHTAERWILLYIERWLKVSMQLEDGTQKGREKGTPQGGVISPLLSNIFLHHVFDEWMTKNHRESPFERYCDDIVIHCKTETQAKALLDDITQRLAKCKLEVNPEKTRIVYCKDENRRGNYKQETFDFAGYTFRARLIRSKSGAMFVGFTPAISQKSAQAIREQVRKWKLWKASYREIWELARMINPVVRGWIYYYGKFCKSAMYPVLRYIDSVLVKWACRKYKKFRGHPYKAIQWLSAVMKREPGLFAQWKVFRPTIR